MWGSEAAPCRFKVDSQSGQSDRRSCCNGYLFVSAQKDGKNLQLFTIRSEEDFRTHIAVTYLKHTQQVVTRVKLISMEFYRNPLSSMKYSWSSLEFHGVSIEFHGMPCSSMEFHVMPWNSMDFQLKFHGIPWIFSWSSMEFHGVPWSIDGVLWNVMEFHGVSMKFDIRSLQFVWESIEIH